ncbi:hypothetical protein KC19_VG053600 [Ceratodon purpureus]|uniref:Uncharacterized protein n=1 Tax=Ceratodon purpureus TaxID=3225 RepID=A0A8T0HMQ2_CERPU|nr:hypothetical protein KC19_VG053600 [Ceratodon purpureus]
MYICHIDYIESQSTSDEAERDLRRCRESSSFGVQVTERQRLSKSVDDECCRPGHGSKRHHASRDGTSNSGMGDFAQPFPPSSLQPPSGWAWVRIPQSHTGKEFVNVVGAVPDFDAPDRCQHLNTENVSNVQEIGELGRQSNDRSSATKSSNIKEDSKK